jgi:signal transduction histidine kinase
MEQALPYLEREVPHKRIWVATLNEHGTHFVGLLGKGEGMRRRIIHGQIELKSLAGLLGSETVRRIDPQETLENAGLERLRRILRAGGLLVVPLQAMQQLVGVVILEPHEALEKFRAPQVQTLRAMANEIAMVVLARRFEGQMTAADKFRLIGSLAAGVAHNFNNVLQAIIGQASLLELQLGEKAPLSKSVRTIVEGAQRGATLVHQLLSFSSQDVRPFVVLSVRDFLEEAKDFYRSILGGQSELQLRIDEGCKNILGDRGQLQQAIANIIINAREAIQRAGRSVGRVSIEARLVRLAAQEVDESLRAGRYVRIDIEDNGCGMPPEQLARCFEPFFTTKPPSPTSPVVAGYGLGLATCAAIVRQHGGAISAVSEVGKGSLFSLLLPQNDGEVSTDRPPERARHDVLTVGLEAGFSESFRPFFTAEGLEMLACAPSPALWQAIEEELRSARLVIVDLDRFGAEVNLALQRLRQSAPSALIAGLTSDKTGWSTVLASDAQFVIVEKPLSVWALHGLLSRLKAQ